MGRRARKGAGRLPCAHGARMRRFRGMSMERGSQGGSSERRGALREGWALLVAAGRDLPAAWKPLAAADLIYKAIAFAVLAPLTTGLLHLLMARAGLDVVADV